MDVKSYGTYYKILSTVDKVENIRYELEKCLYLAISGRPGYVVMDVPYNVQVAKIDPKKLKKFNKPVKKKKL